MGFTLGNPLVINFFRTITCRLLRVGDVHNLFKVVGSKRTSFSLCSHSFFVAKLTEACVFLNPVEDFVPVISFPFFSLSLLLFGELLPAISFDEILNTCLEKFIIF